MTRYRCAEMKIEQAPRAARRAAPRDRPVLAAWPARGKFAADWEHGPQSLHGDRERRDAADADYLVHDGIVVLPPGREFRGHPRSE
jgi:hypothetical protein